MRETKDLLSLWEEGTSAPKLFDLALKSGAFPTMTARRLSNIVGECFAPRFLAQQGAPAKHLKRLAGSLSDRDLRQLLFLFTCRANEVLADFVREVFWPRYQAGAAVIDNDTARAFVQRAVDDGKTTTRWSEAMIRRVAAYLTGCLADFGLLEAGTRSSRKILAVRPAASLLLYLMHELHFSGKGDNAILQVEDWSLLGLGRDDVLDELKTLSLKGHFVLQAAGDAVAISWRYKDMDEVCDVIAAS